MTQHSESCQMSPVESLQTPCECHGSELIFVFLMFCFSVCVRQYSKCYSISYKYSWNIDSIFILTLKIAVFWNVILCSLVEVY